MFFRLDDEENEKWLLDSLPVPLFSLGMLIRVSDRRVDCLNFDTFVPFPAFSFCRRNSQPVITCRLMLL